MNRIAQEKRWQEEDDAYTLARAEEIKADPERVEGAANAAKRLLAEREKEVHGLRTVAGKKAVEKKPAPSGNKGKDAIGDFVLPRY
jgi:hypothetical protein